MSAPLPIAPLTSLAVRPWPDALIDDTGHPVCSAYVERFWLGVLGPSATLLLRRLATGLDEAPDGYDIDLQLTAAQLGLGHRSGRNSPFMRAMARCCRFAAMQLLDDHTLRVRRYLPPLSRLQLERLPTALQAAHRAWLEGPPPDPTIDPRHLRERARGLALSLLELGEEPEAAERQLHRWRLHPAVAHDAVAWARAQRSEAILRLPSEDLPPEAA